MPMISVRAKKGVTAYTAPRGGLKIPSDAFMQVEETPYIRRLINVWGDVEVEKGVEDSAAPTPAKTASAAGAKPSQNGPVTEPIPPASNAK